MMKIRVNVEGLTNMEVAKEILAQEIKLAKRPKDLNGKVDITFVGENNQIQTDTVVRCIDDLIYFGQDNVFEDLVRNVAPELSEDVVNAVIQAADDLDTTNNGYDYLMNLDTLLTLVRVAQA